MNIVNTHLKFKKDRIYSLDFLRGIAACSVVLFHYTAETSINLLDTNLLRMVGINGHFGVEVFFILSGLVIPYSMHANSYKINLFGKFLLKRTIRIEIPYLIIIGVEVLLIYMSSLTPWRNSVSERFVAFNLPSHIFYLNDVIGEPWLLPIFWTLAIEFQFYLLIAVLFPLFLQSRPIYRILSVGIIALCSFLFPQSYLFFSHSLFFLLGIIAFQAVAGVIKRHEFLSLSMGLLFLVFLQNGSTSFIVALATLIVILYCKCDWKWSGLLGAISYSLYLIHIPFGGRLLVLTNRYVQSEELKTTLIIAYFISTIVIAWLFYLLIERPAIHMSQRVTYKKNLLEMFN